MQFILGLLTAVVLFVVFYMGYKLGRKPRATPKEVDEIELQRAKNMRASFLNMMNYDLDTALKRKKVNE